MATDVSFEVPKGLPDVMVMQSAAKRLGNIPDAGERCAALQTLFRLVDGVLEAPQNAKRRRLKKTNPAFHQKVGRFSAAMEFLRGAGFVDTDDQDTPGEEGRDALLTMPVAYIARLNDAHQTLAAVAGGVGVMSPEIPKTQGIFNPFQVNAQGTDGSRKQAPGGKNFVREAEQVRQEVRKRERELAEAVEHAPEVSLSPSAFWLSAGRRLEDVVRETSLADGASSRAADDELLREQLSSVRAALAGTTAGFQSADKKRLVELGKTLAHTSCTLRVICPDKAVLQVRFQAKATCKYVMEQLAPLLSPDVCASAWYLYQSPPLRRLGPGESLMSAGLTPGANVYLGFDAVKPPPPYLSAELMNEMGPPRVAEVASPAAKFAGEAPGLGAGQGLSIGPAGGPAIVVIDKAAAETPGVDGGDAAKALVRDAEKSL